MGVVAPKFLIDSKALKPAASSPNLLGPHPDRILLADHTGSGMEVSTTVAGGSRDRGLSDSRVRNPVRK